MRRVTIQAIHIGSKGSGTKKHADLSREPRDFNISDLTAVGQNTSSDQINGEAQQIRSRQKNPNDVLGKSLLGCDDPA